MADDSSWYELYKSITSEKDLAEKDQQRMVRRERRRIKRKARRRKVRIDKIVRSLKVREAYRARANIPMRSTSRDRYHDYTDREHEERLLQEQLQLRQQIVAQHQSNQNIQNVLMGLAAVRALLDAAQGSGSGAEGAAVMAGAQGPE